MNEIPNVTIPTKAVEQYFSVVLLIVFYNVALTFKKRVLIPKLLPFVLELPAS